MSNYRQMPTFERTIAKQGLTDKSWYRWFGSVDQGQPPASEGPIHLGASPFTWQAPQKGFVIITGGTVSAVQFTRSAVYNTGQTAGLFPVSANDSLTITFSAAPTVTFVPQ